MLNISLGNYFNIGTLDPYPALCRQSGEHKKMHELSIMSNILDIVIEYAEKYNAKRVAKINLLVGELSDLIPEWMQTYFDFVSRDTIAEKAELNIERIPTVIRCKECGTESTIKRENLKFYCPHCESTEVELLSGREFTIQSIEIN